MVDKHATLVLYASNIKEKEFEREALKFAKHHKLSPESVVAINCRVPLWRRRKRVMDALEARTGLGTIAMFCHGWPRRIQFGFNLDNIEALAGVINECKDFHTDVILYACSCGRRPGLNPKRQVYFPEEWVTEGSFALHLAKSLVDYVSVWAHYNSGHTTRNPYALMFESYGVAGWVVEPHHKDWAAWVKALKGPRRFDFFEREI